MMLRRRAIGGGSAGKDYSKQYLTIVSLEDNNVIKWHCGSTSVSYYKYISYSTDGGTTWTSTQSSYNGIPLATLNTGEKMMVKYYNVSAYASGRYYNYFSSTKEFNLEGNIMSLTTSGDFTSAMTISTDNAFKQLFYNCSNLNSAENLVLPATTLAESCYHGMFRGCTSLVTPPELPATTLVENCYREMFRNCSSLNYIKCLATNISANTCTYNWTDGVASSGTFVKDSGMTSWGTGNNGIPSGWTVQDA